MQISAEILKQTLADQHSAFLKKPTGIEREILSSIKTKIKLPHVHVITGIRRCGKSTLLRQIASKFYNDQDFYYINFESERLLNFKAAEFNRVFETLQELFGDKNVFLIDEIQNVENFEYFVRRLNDEGYKFYITGSNASLLSREIGSRLTGRHIDSVLTPFTFAEFIEFKGIHIKNEDLYLTKNRARIKKYFSEYLTNGGMPEYITFGDDEILHRIYEDIIFKDIAVRHGIYNIKQLKETYSYLITNFCRKFSYTSLKKNIKLGSVTTAINYVQYIEQSHFLALINKFDFSLKKQIANEKKPYIIDNGFVSNIALKLTQDKGWLLENIVFNHLNRKYKVFYFNSKNECDFLIMEKNEIKAAYQVCNHVSDENRNREMAGLTEAMQHFGLKKGFFLTFDQEEEIKIGRNKITILPLWKWLLNTN
ncbi:MAG TPA: ATP-binding protein [Bacteroidales bacterium]|nr:ATP-binding protein [Bacteroidales bacterium]HPS15717.1 ATP-binding protein [Bacteroidales bacterium]